MYKVVLDTNILVSGLISSIGNPAQIINAFKAKRFYLFYTDEIIAEYKDVLFRGRLKLNSTDVEELIDVIYEIGYPVIPTMSDIRLPDEDDRIFYDTAKYSDCYLVTGNIKHYPTDPFIMTPADFVKLLNEN